MCPAVCPAMCAPNPRNRRRSHVHPPLPDVDVTFLGILPICCPHSASLRRRPREAPNSGLFRNTSIRHDPDPMSETGRIVAGVPVAVSHRRGCAVSYQVARCLVAGGWSSAGIELQALLQHRHLVWPWKPKRLAGSRDLGGTSFGPRSASLQRPTRHQQPSATQAPAALGQDEEGSSEVQPYDFPLWTGEAA
jgi:hypothetical protein